MASRAFLEKGRHPRSLHRRTEKRVQLRKAIWLSLTALFLISCLFTLFRGWRRHTSPSTTYGEPVEDTGAEVHPVYPHNTSDLEYDNTIVSEESPDTKSENIPLKESDLDPEQDNGQHSDVTTGDDSPEKLERDSIATVKEPAIEDNGSDSVEKVEKDASVDKSSKSDCSGHQCEDTRTGKPKKRKIDVIIGIISDPAEDKEFRKAARETWFKAAMELDNVHGFFFFPQSSEDLSEEARTYGDVVIGNGQHIDMPDAFQMFEHVSNNVEGLHVLRVDVRSYVMISRLISRLRDMCASKVCASEDIWAGKQILGKRIPPEDSMYTSDTTLAISLPYMSSEAYLLSTSLAASLAMMHEEIGLKVYSSEELSMSVWLIPVAVRRIDFGSKAFHLEDNCCVDANGTATVDICPKGFNEAPIVMGLLSDPAHMHMYHESLQKCSY